MPNRVQWNPASGVGHETLDTQHQNMLAQCNALADCIGDSGEDSALKFNTIFSELMAQVRDHFATEEAQLTRCGYPALDEDRDERDEFEYLAADIATTEHFEKVELQRFLSLWCVGHILGSGKKHRAFLESLSTA